MKLYAGPAKQFVSDTVRNQVADKLKDAFFAYFRYNPSPNEVTSWRNSLRAMSDVVTHGGLSNTGVLLEYQLPLSSRRLDCMLTGHDKHGRPGAVVVELKQWEKCEEADGESVLTWVGGGEREVLHPSAQVGGYRSYLQDMHTAFYEGSEPLALAACSYLHNYPLVAGDVLFAPRYQRFWQADPVFTKDEFDRLAGYLGDRVAAGDGMPVLDRVLEAPLRPSKKLMDHVAAMISDQPEYVLLDEQLIVFDKVLACARNAARDNRKSVIIVHGGPGTGKSVIAINLMGRLLREGLDVDYATGSAAFTETLRKIIGRRGAGKFKYFNSYMSAPTDALDVLVCDESHRIRRNSENRYTKATDRTDRPQLDELLSVARVGVYFIDNVQVVRPDEIGSSAMIREHATKAGARVHEYQLEAQFRCSGSDAFVNWIDNTLGLRRTANAIWEGDERFEFRIMPSPEATEDLIRQRVAEGHTGRMTAGFCWPWSKKPLDGGQLALDVAIDGYLRPWNARPDATRLAAGIPKSHLWAREPGGIDQVGCIYTAQGFEFDYVGVIFGHDLRWDPDNGIWVGDRAKSHDAMVKRSGADFVRLAMNTYRVLLTRGLKGCFVTFLDRETERFFRSRTTK